MNATSRLLNFKHFSIPQFDLSNQSERWVVVDQQKDTYLGQPDTVLLQNGQTIFCVYPLGHGAREKVAPRTFVKKSDDGGRTWSAPLNTPENFRTWKNAPTIHRLVTPADKEHLIITVSYPSMRQSFSSDSGKTWSPFRDIFPEAMKEHLGYQGYAAPKSILPVDGQKGHYIAIYHDRVKKETPAKYGADAQLVLIRTLDGGETWSLPEVVSDLSNFENSLPTEPCLIRSPDGKQILSICNEFNLHHPSLMMTSEDEGRHWTKMRAAPASLAGQRHVHCFLPDGRLVMTFRDRSCYKQSVSYEDFVLWVGRTRILSKAGKGSIDADCLRITEVLAIRGMRAWNCSPRKRC